jgi:hypothetical protein
MPPFLKRNITPTPPMGSGTCFPYRTPSTGNYEASGEELKIREASGKDYDFYATRQGYTDPMGWKSTWDSLAYMAEPVNILAQGGYKAFYAGLEQRNDVVVFPLP